MKEASRKKYYDLEKIYKGAANHRRLEMLFTLQKTPNLSTDQIVESLRLNYQTGASHLQKLVRNGLVLGFREGNMVKHKLSPLGQSIIKLSIIS